MRADALDYDLPPDLIATTPADPRDSARLMVVHRATGEVQHRYVADLSKLGIFQPGDLMLVNRSRVLPAYFHGTRAATGGKIRGLYLEQNPPNLWRVMIESRGTLKTGERIDLDSDAYLILTTNQGSGEWSAQYTGPDDTVTLLGRIGAAPLPPYIRRARKAHHLPEVNDDDMARYNTVYAQEHGSVAAPTAGLHFTPELLAALDAIGVRRAEVTLHVGLGTFAPIRCDDVNDHPIHAEAIAVPAKTIRLIHETRSNGRVITAVGTTTVRAIESLPTDLEHSQSNRSGVGATFCPEGQNVRCTTRFAAARSKRGTHHRGIENALEPLGSEGFSTSTQLFITPDNGFQFRYTDRLLTNFHLPRSTLLALVAALPNVGIDRLLGWYRQAIDHGYRFYSYGDAMLIV